MTFKIDRERHFTRTCAGADGSTFEATFRALTDEQVEVHDFTSLDGEKAFLRDVTIMIGDVVDEHDKPISFTAELLSGFLGAADLRGALLRGYRAGITGARAGN